MLKKLFSKKINYLLFALPIALIGRALGWGDLSILVLSAISVIPLAGMIGTATESLALYTGPKIGGLLNATLGNAAELIITIMAIRSGYLELVKASITGSILGNLLLVMGVAMLAGGLKNGLQTFDRRQVSNYSILLLISVSALIIPSMFKNAVGHNGSIQVENLSIGVAIVMIVLYALGLYYSFREQGSPVAPKPAIEVVHASPHWTKTQSLILLALATFGVVFASELLVNSVEHVITTFGISEFFLGVILIPIIGNVAEHLVAVTMAYRNHMELSTEIAISSSLQIALFVAPLLVFISLLMGNPLNLVFNLYEILALGVSILITTFVAIDGESNWLEGAALTAVYIILAISFFFLPTGA
ncbi:MAG TPA: calcium/proton exchanger [Bellilinea sp.]|nr:calcium/proton exchanger [Bellilinea sp.]